MIDRSKVLWLGHPPSAADHEEHVNRGLAICTVDATKHDAMDLVHARGLVLNAVPPHLPAVVQALGCVGAAVNHGMQVLVLLADSAAHAWLQENLEKRVPAGPARDRIRYRIAASAPEAAEMFARFDPGPSVNCALTIVKPSGLELSETQIFLLQRAFCDCTSIALTALPGGRSAMTLLVQATLANSLAGPHPLPFFAKVDHPAQILAERECYERYAESHIPWHLRPNLQPRRCLIGTELGILVGSFVTKSDSLWSLITEGRAGGAIQALFGETLASWRDPESVMSTDVGSIAPGLQNVFVHRNVRKRYVREAGALGFHRDPAAVWEGFLNLPTRAWQRAPIHGDLHADNVRVRSADAIIIDLARVTMGPPGADPACLEVWIAFQLPPSNVVVDEAQWLATVRDLYAPASLLHASSPKGNHGQLGWLRGSVEQTRNVAMMTSNPTDYAITVALYLVRRAMFEPDAQSPEIDLRRRTVAWILGCQLLEGIQQLECGHQEAA